MVSKLQNVLFEVYMCRCLFIDATNVWNLLSYDLCRWMDFEWVNDYMNELKCDCFGERNYMEKFHLLYNVCIDVEV